MKTFEFEKKGINFAVEVNEEEVICILNANGKTAAEVSAYRHHKAGWGYEVTDKQIMKQIFGKIQDEGNFFVTHDSAEEVAKIIRKGEIEKSKRNILKGDIRLSYYFGDWHRVNSVFVDDIPVDFGDAGNVFKSKKLQEFLGNFPNEDLIAKKLDEYFQSLAKTFLTDSIPEIEKLEGITITYNCYDDMRGKGSYVKAIVFDSFETFEKYVLKAMQGDIEKAAKKQEKLQAAEEEARRTGKNVELYHYSDDCNDPNEDCSVDIITVYMTPEGKKKLARSHTW